MTEARDPRRLLDSSEPAFVELEPGLRQARAQGPSAAQRARMRAALGLPATGDAPAEPGTAQPAQAPSEGAGGALPAQQAPSGGALPTWVKLVVLGAIGVGVIAGVQRAWFSHERAPAVSAPGLEPPAQVAPQPEAPAAVPQLLQPAPATLPTPAASDNAAPRAEGAARKRNRAADAGRSAPAPLTQQRAPVQAPADPGAELALLKRAKAHARSAPQRALELLAEHERRFAQGALAQEREVIAIEALLAGGLRAEAEQRATRFFQQFSDSAHARRVRALLSERTDSEANPQRPGHPSH